MPLHGSNDSPSRSEQDFEETLEREDATEQVSECCLEVFGTWVWELDIVQEGKEDINGKKGKR